MQAKNGWVQEETFRGTQKAIQASFSSVNSDFFWFINPNLCASMIYVLYLRTSIGYPSEKNIVGAPTKQVGLLAEQALAIAPSAS